MGTREGQELLLGRLSEIIERLAGMATAEKLEELLRDIRAIQNQSIVPAHGAGGRNKPGQPRKFNNKDPAARGGGGGRPGPGGRRGGRRRRGADSRRAAAPAPRAAERSGGERRKRSRTGKD